MFEFHKNREQYFTMQVQNATQHVIPFIQQHKRVGEGTHVLEVGCGEAGVLKAFIAKGCTAVGVELYEDRLTEGKKYLQPEIAAGSLQLIASNIYEVQQNFDNAFDIIILKDVIEHIHDQPKLIAKLKQFLKSGGIIFFGFPPWYMPYGGHQQVCNTAWLARMPYVHLLPTFAYKRLLQACGEGVPDLMEIRDTRITIEQFEKYAFNTGYTIVDKIHYLINPIYQYKFGWQARKQYKLIQAIPYFRNFFTTCVYYIITPKVK